MRSELAVVVALAACGSNSDDTPGRKAPPSRPSAELRKLDSFTMPLPDGWTSHYDGDADRWRLGAPPQADGTSLVVTFERAPSPVVAGPDALRHHMVTHEWERGTAADIEKRQPLSDGFATVLQVQGPRAPAHRELHVVRELGSQWFRCIGSPIGDDATRDQVLALCRSVKRTIEHRPVEHR